jgi:hypothetical protein
MLTGGETLIDLGSLIERPCVINGAKGIDNGIEAMNVLQRCRNQSLATGLARLDLLC